MNKAILYILLLILVSCNNGNTNTDSSNTGASVTVPVKAVPVKPKPAINFFALHGNWIPVSKHYGRLVEIQGKKLKSPIMDSANEKNVLNYLEDTTRYNFNEAYLLKFDSVKHWNGKWSFQQSDLKSDGKYYLNTEKHELLLYDFISTAKGRDSLYRRRIIYLDNKYMLLEKYWGAKEIDFYIKTKMQYAPGGG